MNLDHIWEKIKSAEKPWHAKYNDDWKRQWEWTQKNIEYNWSTQNSIPSATSIVGKENDVVYQRIRLKHFRYLLDLYPDSYEEIKTSATFDIPPVTKVTQLLRGEIWAAALGVRGDTTLIYDSYDRDKVMDTDRQLDLDIPRCHQYNPLLASKEGHAKLKRVLKTWIVAEMDMQVYWQGLDSLCAPFVSYFFNDEGMAFCTMQKFIQSFCHGFFVKDNSLIMRE
jgi:TBC domain-containing protein kinase-like protein